MEELENILWAYRTTPRKSTRMTPFHLVCGGEALNPVEIGMECTQVQAYDSDNPDKQLLELDLITKNQKKLAMWLSFYQQRICQTYNKRAIPSTFQVNDFV